MIKIKNVVKFIFILLAVLIIVIWFQFFHNRFFEENKNEAINTINENKMTSDNSVGGNKEELDREKYISIGEELYTKISNFEFQLGDFYVEHGATEVLNIEELKEFVTGKAFEDFIKDCAIEKDDNEKYWDIGNRGSDIMYLNHHEMEIKKATDEKIEFTIVEYYAKNVEDINLGYQNLGSDQVVTQRNKFTIIRENNAWKISEYTKP
ncbi:MAG: hypothetical protein J6J36_02195 [Clostridia bacterium]|nr:hypothetical protein [Clostridia bacterium]